MTIKDILTITGGNTKVMIFSADKEDRYIRLWYGRVDDINFPYVPYGYYDVEHMTVINEEDILQVHFEYPELSKEHKDIINEEAVGYPCPTDWIEKLFIKYRDWKYVREILTTKNKDEVYDEIRIIPDEEFVEGEFPVWNEEEVTEFIYENISYDISRDAIAETLRWELEYMERIGIATETRQ